MPVSIFMAPVTYIDHLKIFFQNGLDIKVSAPILTRIYISTGDYD